MSKLKFPFYGKVLVEAIGEFDSLNVYPIYDNFKYFHVLVPGHSEPFTGSILGSAGEFYGFNLFVGSDGLAMYRSFSENTRDLSPERLRKLNMYSFEMVTSEKLSPENRKWLKAAGVKVQPRTYYPDFTIYTPNKAASLPGDKEVAVLLYAVKGLVKAIKTGVFAPSDLHTDNNGAVFTIKTGGKPISPDIEILNGPEPKPNSKPAAKPKPESAKPKPKSKAAPKIDLSKYAAQMFEFSSLPILEEVWTARSFGISAVVGDDLMCMLALIDVDRGPIQFEVLTAEQNDDAGHVWDELRQMLKGESMSASADFKPSLPREFIFFDPDLYAIAEKVFTPLKVRCSLEGTDSELYYQTEKLVEFMNEQFSKGPQQMLMDMKETLPEDVHGRIEELLDEIVEGLPDDDDYDGWVKLDSELKRMIYDGFDHDKKFKSKRALKEYFGKLEGYIGVDDYNDIFRQYAGNFVVDAYCNWFASDYRDKENGETVMQKWMRSPKTAPELRYAMGEFFFGLDSFFKLSVKNRKNGKILLTDMLDGEGMQYEVIDFSLAATATSGMYLPAKVYRLGDFDFYAAMGPMLNKKNYHTLMGFYEKSGVETKLDNPFDYDSYLFGWIWRWYGLLNLPFADITVNADGDLLVVHHCVFNVDDEKALRAKLASLAFIDYDKKDEFYLWIRPDLSGKPSGFADDHTIVLGVLTFKDGKLLVDVNSEKRYSTCRSWLDKIEGLTFVKVDVISPDAF